MMYLLLLFVFIGFVIYSVAAIASLKHRITRLEHKLFDVNESRTEPLTSQSESPKPITPHSKPLAEPSQLSEIQRPTTSKPESKLTSQIKNFLTTRNVIALIGALLLLFGCGFLVKYASERGLLSIQWRLAMTAGIGLAALVIGWLVRRRREMVALVLQGLGLGIIFLTVFAAFQFYSLLGVTTAFAILTLTVIAGILLAVLQNAKYLALFSFFGGFIAPLLLQTGQPRITVLFSYYFVLNIGVFATAWFKQWRELNYLGFLATFLVTGLWTYQSYTEPYFTVTETFLILFFVMYLIIAIAFSYHQTYSKKKIIDTTLTFALPIMFFLYQAKLLHYHATHLAITAFATALMYGVIAFVLKNIKTQNRPMTLAMFACSVIFFTAAIPLALQNHWTGITWALEGAALFWFGNLQHKKLTQYAGLLLQFAASIVFIHYFPPQHHSLYLLNGTFLGTLILVTSAYFTAYVAKENQSISAPLFALGSIWFTFIGFYENWVFFHDQSKHILPWVLSTKPSWRFLYSSLLFFSVSAFIASIINRLSKFTLLQIFIYLATVLLILAEISCLSILLYTLRTPSHIILFNLLATLVICYAALFFFKDQISNAGGILISALLWFAALFQLTLWIIQFNNAVIGSHHDLRCITFGIAISLYFLVFECSNVQRVFPFSFKSSVYFRQTPLVLIFLFLFWFLATTFSATGTTPRLLYLPLFNPIDLVTGLGFFSIYYWHKSQREWLNTLQPHWRFSALIGISIAGFIWINAILLRTLHNWIKLPLAFHAIMHSSVTQISLSILWAIAALTLTISGSIKKWRAAWIVGAILIGITVLKVLLVDLGNQNTITRIVSFISVGILLLVVGYFAPLPPKKN